MNIFEKLFLSLFLVYIIICIGIEEFKMKWYDNLRPEYQAAITALVLILVLLLSIFIPAYVVDHKTPLDFWHLLCGL